MGSCFQIENLKVDNRRNWNHIGKLYPFSSHFWKNRDFLSGEN